MKRWILFLACIVAIATIIGIFHEVGIEVIIASTILGGILFWISYSFCFVFPKEETGTMLHSRGFFGLSIVFWIIYSIFIGIPFVCIVLSQSVGGTLFTFGMTGIAGGIFGPVYWFRDPHKLLP